MATAEKVMSEIWGAMMMRPFELFLKFFATTYLIRSLGADSFGQVATALSLLLGFSVVCRMGMDQLLQIQLPQESRPTYRRQIIRRALSFRLGLSILIGLAALALYPTLWTLWAAVALTVDVIAGFGTTVCYSRMEAKLPALGRLIAPALQIGLTGLLAGTHPQIFILVWLLPNLVQGLPAWKKVISEEKIFLREPSLSLPLGPKPGDWAASFGIDGANFILSRFSDIALIGFLVATKEAGYLQAAQTYYQTMALVLMTGFSEISVSLYAHQSSANRAQLYYFNIVADILLLVIPPLLLVPLLPDLVAVLFGAKFDQAAYVGVLIAALILGSVPIRILGSGTNTTMLWASGAIKTILATRVGFGFLQILVNVLILKFLSPTALAVVVGSSCVGIVLAATEYWLLRSGQGRHHPGMALAPLLILGLLSAGISWGVCELLSAAPWWIRLAGPVCGGIFFVVSAWLIKPLPRLPLTNAQHPLVRLYGFMAR